MRYKISLRLASLLLAATALGAPGCTPTPISVKGQLTWDDGKPVSGAHLRFVPTSGTQEALGQTDKDGEFTLVSAGGASGVMPGDYKVVVIKMPAAGVVPELKGDPTNPDDIKKAVQGQFEKQGQGKVPPKIVDPIPPVYASDTTTPLTAKVEKANQRIELKIKKSG